MRLGQTHSAAALVCLLSLGTPTLAPAQFQLPAPPAGAAAAPALPAQLKYQYGYGSESEAIYRSDADLDPRLRDNIGVFKPQINGFVLYRPVNGVELTLEMIAEKEFALQEEDLVTLPSGETQAPRARHASLLVDQAFIGVGPGAGFELAGGRKNYEDERHWLYDTSLDMASVAWRRGTFRAEALFGREVRWDLDLAAHSRQTKDRIDTAILYADYRGIADLRLAAYTIMRHDRARVEGRPDWLGLRALGSPSNRVSYWGELAWVRGKDEAGLPLRGHAFDVGFTYRLTGVPLWPSVTVAYAFGSGDDNAGDRVNRDYRQSGLQSNEARFSGVSMFKIYGEALDPELSNLKIVTAGFGVRPAPLMTVELVLHSYRLDEVAEQLRSSALTAEINQAGRSRELGNGIDLVVGFRRLFGLRLGLDLRAGWFRPGAAFIRNEGDDENPVLRDAQTGFAAICKLWW